MLNLNSYRSNENTKNQDQFMTSSSNRHKPSDYALDTDEFDSNYQNFVDSNSSKSYQKSSKSSKQLVSQTGSSVIKHSNNQDLSDDDIEFIEYGKASYNSFKVFNKQFPKFKQKQQKS